MAKYKIQVKKSAAKEIKKLPSKDLKKILIKIESLADNPRPADSKKLSNQERYRIRYGHYRVLYEIIDEILIIIIVKMAQH